MSEEDLKYHYYCIPKEVNILKSLKIDHFRID